MTDRASKKGIGIVGYGGFGEFIRTAWNKMPNAHVTAICDANPQRNPDEDVNFYTNYSELLADESVDIVSIATPPSSHYLLSIEAMEAGKHVLIEKPLAISTENALEIKEVAERTGRKATVNFVLRFNPLVELLRDIVQNEVLGKIRRLDLRNYAMQETVPPSHWFWDPEIGGRILLEHGVHFFDLAGSVIGARAKKCWGLGVEREPGMEDRMFSVVRYENDVIGTYWHSFSRPRPLETTTFHFAFDLGEIEMVGWIPLELKVWGWTDEKGLNVLRKHIKSGEIQAARMEPMTTLSSEIEYSVEYDVDTKFELGTPKLEVYADNLRSIMDDLITAIDNPSHQMRVTIEDAIEAVRVAEQSTKAADEWWPRS